MSQDTNTQQGSPSNNTVDATAALDYFERQKLLRDSIVRPNSGTATQTAPATTPPVDVNATAPSTEPASNAAQTQNTQPPVATTVPVPAPTPAATPTTPTPNGQTTEGQPATVKDNLTLAQDGDIDLNAALSKEFGDTAGNGTQPSQQTPTVTPAQLDLSLFNKFTGGVEIKSETELAQLFEQLHQENERLKTVASVDVDVDSYIVSKFKKDGKHAEAAQYLSLVSYEWSENDKTDFLVKSFYESDSVFNQLTKEQQAEILEEKAKSIEDQNPYNRIVAKRQIASELNKIKQQVLDEHRKVAQEELNKTNAERAKTLAQPAPQTLDLSNFLTQPKVGDYEFSPNVVKALRSKFSGKTKEQLFDELFVRDGKLLEDSLADALMNYHKDITNDTRNVYFQRRHSNLISQVAEKAKQEAYLAAVNAGRTEVRSSGTGDPNTSSTSLSPATSFEERRDLLRSSIAKKS